MTSHPGGVIKPLANATPQFCVRLFSKKGSVYMLNRLHLL